MALSKLQFSKLEFVRFDPIKETSFIEQVLNIVFGIFLLAKDE